MSFHWPENFRTVPLLEKVEKDVCYFKGGENAKIDAIIFCTGYKHHFPFMHSPIRLRTDNRLWCDALHEGVVLPSNQRVMYIGMQDQWFTFNMFDAQAWYARDIILGRIKLPTQEIMAAEWKQHRAEEEALDGSDESAIRYQANYVKRLHAFTDYPKFDYEQVVQCFIEWEHNKHTNIMTFRDQPHASVMTGTMAPVHHTPWLKEFDDSIENYVNRNKQPADKSASAAL
jgi:trimethylamine monooxygenase